MIIIIKADYTAYMEEAGLHQDPDHEVHEQNSGRSSVVAEEKDLETDMPDLLDLSSLSLEELRGRKVNHVQARSIRGRHVGRNSETGQFECELCDYKRLVQYLNVFIVPTCTLFLDLYASLKVLCPNFLTCMHACIITTLGRVFV